MSSTVQALPKSGEMQMPKQSQKTSSKVEDSHSENDHSHNNDHQDGDHNHGQRKTRYQQQRSQQRRQFARRPPRNRPYQRQRNQPPWISMPGAPPRPNFSDFTKKMAQMRDARRKHIDEIKNLQASLRQTVDRSAIDDQRKKLRERMNEIDALRKSERDLRVEKNQQIAKIRKQRHEITDKLRLLQVQLGGLNDLKEVDQALNFVMKKMQTSGGGLRAQKRTVKRLHQLEQAKSLLLQLQPLTQAIQQAGEKEVLLQQQYREIHERIGTLNREYEDEYQSRQSNDKEVRKSNAERTAVYKQCDDIRVQVKKLDHEMDSFRANHNKAVRQWDKWCDDARIKYAEKMQAEREARRKKAIEAQNARRQERNIQQTREKKNPLEIQIGACETLIRYLYDLKLMTKRDEQERARRIAAEAFDLNKAVPKGFVVLNEGKWAKPMPLSKAAKKQQKVQQKQSTASHQRESKTQQTSQKKDKPVSADQTAQSNQNKNIRVLQHPEEKVRLFKVILLEPPTTLVAIQQTINKIRAKQQEYRSHANKVNQQQTRSIDNDDGGDDNNNDDNTVQDHSLADDNVQSAELNDIDNREQNDKGAKHDHTTLTNADKDNSNIQKSEVVQDDVTSINLSKKTQSDTVNGNKDNTPIQNNDTEVTKKQCANKQQQKNSDKDNDSENTVSDHDKKSDTANA